jgi:hypothetical protein
MVQRCASTNHDSPTVTTGTIGSVAWPIEIGCAISSCGNNYDTCVGTHLHNVPNLLLDFGQYILLVSRRTMEASVLASAWQLILEQNHLALA